MPMSKFNISIIVLAIFIVVTGVHLYASLKQDRALRAKTKPFILLSLLVFYCLSAEDISVTAVLALVFSWIGDLLLIPKGTKWFTAGGISFMISHVFFIWTYASMTEFSNVGMAAMILLPLVFITATVIIFKKLRPFLPEKLFYPMMLYLIINGGMNCFAWFCSICSPGTAAAATMLGALLFYISDTTLFFVRFKEDCRIKTHFLVMLTYSLGEFLIVIGLILH